MKKIKLLLIASTLFIVCQSESDCNEHPTNTSAKDEQAHTETNQRALNKLQPAPTITWSLERDNLIKRFKLQNDRSIVFYMYVFIEGVAQPIGYYQVNKVSSVNSQLTNTMQLVDGNHEDIPMPSPAEDGSYGENGNAVFGFTPEDIYIEHNMKYIASTVPLAFATKPNLLTVIDVHTAGQLKTMMDKINGK